MHLPLVGAVDFSELQKTLEDPLQLPTRAPNVFLVFFLPLQYLAYNLLPPVPVVVSCTVDGKIISNAVCTQDKRSAESICIHVDLTCVFEAGSSSWSKASI